MRFGLDEDDLFLGGLIAVLVALFALFAVASIHESKQWAIYAEAHECKIVGKSRGGMATGVGVTSNGSVAVVPVVEADKKIWQCKDGEIQIR